MEPSITLPFLALLLVAHWLGDFVFQTDAMAKGKSSSNKALTKHILAYSGVMFVALIGVTLNPFLAFGFAAINGIAHWITDYFTSRITKKLWAEGKVHEFFVVIGLDQVFHHAVLFSLASGLGL